MSTHRYEFTRKNTKKATSKEKGYALNSFRPFQRKSKDFTDLPNESQMSPRQPNNIIANLRSQLGNLKQEVAKLSKKDLKNRQSEPYIDHTHRSEYEKKINIKNGITSEMKQNTSKLQTKESFHDDYNYLQTNFKKLTAENQELKVQISNFVQKLNDFEQEKNKLNNQMNELNDKYRRQYEAKIYQYEIHRQRKQRAKLTEQNDQTITFQNQLLANKQQINELERHLKNSSDENRVLRNKLLTFVDQSQQIQRLKTEMKNYQEITKKYVKSQNQNLQNIKKFEQKINELNSQIYSLNSELQKKQKIIFDCKEDIKKYIIVVQDKNVKYANLEREKAETIKQLATKINQSEAKAVNLQKSMQQQSNIFTSANITKIHSHSLALLQKQLKQKKEIIQLHEKSLSNQHNDISYLQNELSKCNHYRFLSRDQQTVISFDNEQLMSIGLAKLNQKYRH